MENYLPFIIYYEVCCCLHIKWIVYKHVNTWVHIGPSKSMHLWSIIYIFTRVFEILRETCKTLAVGICCLQTCNWVVNVLVMGLVLGQSLMLISTTGILLCAKVSPLYNVLWECIVVIYTLTTLFTNIWIHECTFGHQSLGVCKVSYTYLLRCLRYWEKHVKYVCCCLQTCTSVVYVAVMGLVLSQSLMVISTMGTLL